MKTKFTLLFAIAMIAISVSLKAQNWSLNGNSNTKPQLNFLGTIDNRPLSIRTNNANRIIITSIGRVGIGTTNPFAKLDVNGSINIKEDSAIYFGGQKILSTGGTQNLFLGINAGRDIQRGDFNTAIGFNALPLNSTGYNNTAVGGMALYALDPGNNNTAVGYTALMNLQGGTDNTALGKNALGGMVLGGFNIAIGSNAMSKTDGGLGISQNIALGTNALLIHKFGDNTVGIGAYSFSNMFAGENNTAIGAATNVNDSFNISNSTAIGNGALLTASNQVRIGNSDIASIGGYKSWTKISDARVKQNIKSNVPGLAFINKLNPVTYTVNLDAADKITQRPAQKDVNGKVIGLTQKEIATRKAEEKIIQTGFLAQDVEKAAKSLNYNFSGVDVAKTDKDLYGLRYAEFVVPLVKAVQELSTQNDALKSENDALKARLDKIEQLLNVNNAQAATLSLSSAKLDQNIPNPSKGSTTINYYLPQNINSAALNFTDVNGKLLKTYSLSANTNGQVVIQTNELTAGVYQYSLIVNGKVADTKKMVVGN